MGKRATLKDWIILGKLAGVILQNVEGCIVEIGLGTSTIILSGYAKKYNVNYYACDKSERKCKWLKDYLNHDKLFIHNERSIEFMEKFDDKVALFFIDGDHRYENVIKEAEFFIDKLVPGGVGFFHDTYVGIKWYGEYVRRKKPEATTYKARLDMEKMDSIWCLTFPYTAQERGLTMVLKKEENRPFYRM